MAEIHGVEIDLEEPDDDAMVTDVIVLARTVRHNAATNRVEDMLLISAGRTTTGMVQRGMLSEAAECMTPNEDYGG